MKELMSNVTVDKDGGIRPAMDNGWRVGMGLPPILKTTLSIGDAANHLSAADDTSQSKTHTLPPAACARNKIHISVH
jgi:hypothetical protein